MQELIETLLTKSKINIENIQIDIFNLILLPNKIQIIEWLNSNDFQEYYKDDEYAPIFNPNTFNYNGIEPDIAWTLNMPIPPFFDFYMIASHATGNNAIWDGLKVLGGGAEIVSSQSGNALEQYKHFYSTILQYNGNYNFTYLALNNFIPYDENTKKLYSLMPKKKAFCLVKDPILLLKSMLNIQLTNPNIPRDINMTYPMDTIIENAVNYGCGYNFNKEPNMDLIGFYIAFRYMHYNSTNFIENCKHIDINDILFIDGEELIGDGILNVLKKIDKKLNLSLNYNLFEINKERLTIKKTKYLSLTNFNIYINESDLYKTSLDQQSMHNPDSIILHIVDSHNIKGIDITNLFFDNNYTNEIKISTSQQSLNKLRSNDKLMHHSQIFIHKFIDKIKKQLLIEEKKKIKEEAIIDYLCKNRIILKYFIDTIEYYKKPLIQTNNANIINGWKFYKELLKKAE